MKLDLIGKKFNRLEVISVINKNINGNFRTICICKCLCGKERQIRYDSLKNNKTRSCGCLKLESLKLGRNKKEKGEHGKNSLFHHYKWNAKRRNLLFSLSKEEFRNLIFKNCHYCNSIPKNKFTSSTPNSELFWNGIDRKDPKIGYTKENCIPCCKQCNYGKNDLTYDEYILYLNQLIEYRKNLK